MVMINVEGSDYQTQPECPLCKKQFKKIPYNDRWLYVCDICEIFIDTEDPAIHAWGSYIPEDDKDIFCPSPKCGHEMNFFFRSDQFMKAYCPKCHTSVCLSEELPLPVDLIKLREAQERKERDNG